MKKLALAVAIAAISGQAAAAQVYSDDTTTLDVYGQIRTSLAKSSESGEADFYTNSSRISVLGTQKLTDDLTAKGKYQVKYSQSNNFYNDDTWVGLASKKFGEVRIGRQWTIWDDQMGGHDYTYWNGGSASLGGGVYGTTFLDSTIKYQLNLGQFTLLAEHMLSPVSTNSAQKELTFSAYEGAGNVVIDKSNSLGLVWSSDFGLTVAGIYAATNLDKAAVDADTGAGTPATPKGDLLDTTSAGLTAYYSTGPLTVGVQLSRVTAQADSKADFDQTKNGFGLGGSYKWSSTLSTYVAYDYVKADNEGDQLSAVYKEVTGGTDIRADETNNKTQSLAVGVRFRPASSFLTWAEIGRFKYDNDTLKTGEAKKNDKSNETVVAVGARYYF